MDNKLFCISSGKSLIIKNLLEVIKPYIKETNFIFDKDGIKISAKDKSGTSFTYIKLDQNRFEYFNCEKRYILGVDTVLFFKCIKSTTRSDTITFYMNENEENKLGIKLSDSSGCKTKDYKLPVLDLEDKIFEITDLPHDHIINISSVQFHQIIKDIDLIEGETVEITSSNKQLSFESIDGSVNIKTSLCEVTGDPKKIYIDKQIKFTKSNDSIFQGRFKIAYLINFIKASHLCESMNIFLGNDKPLCLEYSVADLGSVTFVLT
jgi:proliferating cell nuclear antigen PCNA